MLSKNLSFLLAFIVAIQVIYAQKIPANIPENAIFYMEINGNAINNKINWEKLNQSKLVKKFFNKNSIFKSWSDYSQTGIEYKNKQYQYSTVNDSVTSYVAYLPLNSDSKFEEFINNKKEKGLVAIKKGNYSYISLDKNMFVAWNKSTAILHYCTYQKPYKYQDYATAVADSTAAVAVTEAATYAVDTVAVAVQPDENFEYNQGPIVEESYKEEVYEKKTFDYKEEISALKTNKKYYQNEIKSFQKLIKETDKNITYLTKFKKYPNDKKKKIEQKYDAAVEESVVSAAVDSIQTDMDLPYKEEIDSVYATYNDEFEINNSENFKIVQKISEKLFDDFYNTNSEFSLPNKFNFAKNSNSDIYIVYGYSNYMNILKGKSLTGYGLYESIFGNFSSEIFNTSSAFNIFFENDNVRVVNSYKHNNPKIHSEFAAVYDGKFNKKLAQFIDEKTLGYYSMNIKSEKYLDLMYRFFGESFSKGKEFKNEAELILETVKVFLDEKEISKIATGSGIFTLNGFKPKTVSYIDYQYNEEDFTTKEVKKTKEINAPDFTFAFATEKDEYWKKVFDVFKNNKKFNKNIVKTADYFMFKADENEMIDQLYFTAKDGIVIMTTSLGNLNKISNGDLSNLPNADKKLIKNHPAAGRMDLRKLVEIVGADLPNKTSKKDEKYLNFFKQNLGNVSFYTETKENIETTINYQINDNHDNSLMYFFDLFEELYELDKGNLEEPIQ